MCSFCVLQDEIARLREDLRETQSVLREESTRAMKLQRRHTEVLAIKVRMRMYLACKGYYICTYTLQVSFLTKYIL